MSEYIIPSIAIPEPNTFGTFPLKLEYGLVRVSSPEVVSHQFGHGDARVEQRFYLGNGIRTFQIQLPRMTSTQRQSLCDLYDSHRGSYDAFTLNVTEPDNTTSTYTVRFQDTSLSLQEFAGGLYSSSITLVEVPTTYPVYTSTNTLTRFPSAALKTALTSQVQEMFPILKITSVSGTSMYLSDRKLSLDSTIYQPRIVDWSGISQSLGGASDQAQFTLGNADRVMTQVVNTIDLSQADVEFSLFHVGSGTLINLWKGAVSSWSFDAGPTFRLTASDGLYQLRLPYPSRKIVRYTKDAAGNDVPEFAVSDQPVNVGGKKGISNITATSVINDTAYGKALRDIYVANPTYPLPVKCDVIAMRDESEFLAGLGVIGAGPISSFGAGHTLNGKQHHGPGNLGLRRAFGGNYASGDGAPMDYAPDSGSNSFSLDETGHSLVPTTLSGVSFLQIRTTDEKGIQIQNANTSQQEMVAYIAGGLGCWTWTGVGVRVWQTACTNPVWIAINCLLKAKGVERGTIAQQEALFDVDAAVAAAIVCNTMVPKIIGTGTEKQFTFSGVIENEKPLRDWINEVLASCLGYSTFSFGKLKIGLRYNSSTVEAFTVGNIIHNSLSLSALNQEYNDLTVSFADYEYGYQQNTINLTDQNHIAAVGQHLKANINLSGVTTKSQASRITITKLREILGGVDANEQRKARNIGFKTTVLALNVDPGMVCSITHSDMPDGAGEFRVQSWTLNRDFSIDIQGTTTTDAMYDYTIGDKPTDVSPSYIPSPSDSVPDDVQAIGAEPFLLSSINESGTLWTANLTYNPPAVIGPFNSIDVYYEDPTGSGNYILLKHYAYNGISTASDTTRYGTAALQIPQPLDSDKSWNIVVCPSSQYHQVLPTPSSPQKTISVHKADFGTGIAVGTDGDNLVVNGSFEDGLTGWSVTPIIASNVTVDTTTSYSGTKSIKVVGPFSGYAEVVQHGSHDFPVAPGDLFTIEFRIKASGFGLASDGAGLSSPQVNMQNAAGSYLSSIQASLPLGTYDWKFFRITGQVPANATRASFELFYGKMTGTLWYDSLRIYRGIPALATPSDYGADGTGATDSTAAVQQCINDNNSVFIPPGKTYLVGPLTVSGKTSFELSGAGTLKYANNQAASSIMMTCTGIGHLSIDGVIFDGNKANQANNVGDTLNLNNCSDADIDNVVIKNTKGNPVRLTSTSQRVTFYGCDITQGNTGVFTVDTGGTYFAYGNKGIADTRVPIAAPPPPASLSFSVDDYNTDFGFTWNWTFPTTLGTGIGTIRQVRYYKKISGVWTLDSDWITTGVAMDTVTVSAIDGPFPKSSGEVQVEGRIALINYESGKSTYLTSLAPIDIATLPLDASLDNVNINHSYNGSGYLIVGKDDGTMDVSVQYGPPYPDPLTRITPLIAAIPVIELSDGSVLSYPNQIYTANPALDPPGNLQIVTVNMPKPAAATTIWFHVLSVSTSGQLAYKDHTLANSSSYQTISITDADIAGAASSSDPVAAPLSASVSVDASQPNNFYLTASWTLPTDKGGNAGYAVEFQYLDTVGSTINPNGWTAHTQVIGRDKTSVVIGPFPKSTRDYYVVTRVQSYNGKNEVSAWVQSGTPVLVSTNIIYQTPNDVTAFHYVVGGDESNFNFTPSFTLPVDSSSITDYECRVKYFNDAGASTSPISEWMALGSHRIDDLTAFGPFPRQTYQAYTRMQIRTLNPVGGFGNWVDSSDIGSITSVAPPPVPAGVSATITTKTISGQPKWRPTITVTPTTNLGTTENYLREVKICTDAAFTNVEIDWTPLGSVYRTTLVSTTDWFDWDKVIKYAKFRVAAENKDGTPGTYTTSSVVTIAASSGIDLTAADTSKLKGLEVVSGKLQPKVSGTDLIIDPATGAISQNVVDMLKAQNFDTSIFSISTGVFKQTAISTSVLLAGLVATNSLVVGGGSSNVSISPTSVTITGSSSSLTINSSGVTAGTFFAGTVNVNGSINRYSGGIQVGWWDSSGMNVGGTISATRVYGVQWGDISSKPTLVTSVNGMTGAVTISTGSTDWSSITGKPSLVNSVNGSSGAVTITAWTIGYTSWGYSNIADALDNIVSRLNAAGI